MSGATESILRRKAGAGRAAPEITAMSPEKAMRLAFGRAGRDRPGLALRMTGFAIEASSLAGLAALAPAEALVATLARRDGSLGALVADTGLRTALVEGETMGRVGRGEPDPRPPTRIDVLIAGSFVDRALAVFDELAAQLSVAGTVTGYRAGEMVGSAAQLSLVLEDVPLRLFRLDFEFAEGTRRGRLWLAMPAAPRPDGADRDAQRRALEAAVLAAPASLHAVLARLSQPLDRISAWQPGDTLPLPGELLDLVRVEDIEGRRVAAGRLGQINGFRAVRLHPGEAEAPA